MQFFKREQRSLFGEILDWMLIPMLLLSPVSLVLTWLVAQNIANKPFDRTLTANAHVLAQLVQWRNGQAQFVMSQSARNLWRAQGDRQIFFQILGAQGQWLGGEHQFPTPTSMLPLDVGEVDLRDAVLRTVRGQQLDVRVARIQTIAIDPKQAFPPEHNARMVTIQIAETRQQRSLLAAEIIKGVMLPQFIMLPLTIFLMWLALSRGLRPLKVLQDRVRARQPDDASPLEPDIVPIEVSPLVDSVNDMIARQNNLLATQKHFLANAAHQLKTPLAGLRMQADLALRNDANAHELKRSLQQVGLSSMRATHTVNQLLALARAESADMPKQPCNMVRIVQEVLQECLPHALKKPIDLGYEGASPQDTGIWVRGNAILLHEMVRNLVDNAINYTPATTDSEPGEVTVRVLAHTQTKQVVLQVQDSGVGIDALERESIFKPFYRNLGNAADGSGLGLPIVLEIVRQHHATIQLQDTPPQHSGIGALFVIELPSIADFGMVRSEPTEFVPHRQP